MLLLFVSIAGSALLTYLAICFCRRFGVVDVPNKRSAHSTATPRGGGIGIYLPVLAIIVVLLLNGGMDSGLAKALLCGGLLVAAIGTIDDVAGVPVAIRLAAHFVAAIAAALLILPPGVLGGSPVVLVVAVVFIVGMLNIYNFMDGIDGIAGSESAFGGLAMIVFAASSGIAGLGQLGEVVLGASLGFLLWNWPRAKIFMGDAASGFLGFLFGCIVVACAVRDLKSVWLWMIVLGVFLVDSELTLLVRFLRGERVYQAHSKHAYQNLARLYRSHLKVTTGVNLVNLLWLGPIAWLAEQFPHFAPAIAIFALAPLTVAAWKAGAGRDRFA